MDSTIASSNAFTGAFTGEIAALTAAFLWAAATLMFGQIGKQLLPIMLNLAKGMFAIAFIVITLFIRAQLRETTLFEVPVNINITTLDTFYLLLSGGIGIGLGDTAYFAAINALGARRALLFETLATPMAAVLAWLFLGEQLAFQAVAGIGLTVCGIFWVISERTSRAQTSSRQTAAGIAIALLAVFCQASGAVLSRGALANTDIDPLFSALLRLVAGIGFTGVLAIARLDPSETFDTQGLQQEQHKRWHNTLMVLRRPNLLFSVAIAAFLGTYLGIWLQQIALKYTAAGIAQALLATSPLFVLPMATLLGARVSHRSTVGAAIALSGVWLLLAS